MAVDLKKYRVPRTAITVKGLKKLIRDQVKDTSQADWAIENGITPQAVSAFMNDIQTAGLKIPEVLGYRPQVIYLPLDEDLIQPPTVPRRVAKRPTSKADHTKRPVEKKGLKINDRNETKKRLRERK